MVLGRPEVGRGAVIEHGTTSTGRWLRLRRVRLAVWIAVVEGVLVAFKQIPWFGAIAVAGAAIIFYLAYGRHLGSDVARQTSWIAAASQALVALVPILVILVGTLALIGVGILAVLALVVLFSDRR